MPTKKELEQIEKAKSSLKEILKVHMREAFSDTESVPTAASIPIIATTTSNSINVKPFRFINIY
jgi:hypothetical protein